MRVLASLLLFAACTTQTIFTADGRVLVCTSCCSADGCTTVCL